MYSESRNPLLTFLLSYHVWVTSKIQVNFHFDRYWWYCLYKFLKFLCYSCFEVRNPMLIFLQSTICTLFELHQKSRSTSGSRVPLLLLSYACSILYPKHLYHNPIPLLYNPFTIVLHKRLSAYLFRAAHTPACWIGTKRNKDFHPATPQPIGTRIIGPIPRVCEFRIKGRKLIVL